MGSLGSTLARLQCSHLDTWGNREQEPCLHYFHKCQECVPYRDCMPSSSMNHYHQLQVFAMAVMVAKDVEAAEATMATEDVVAAKATIVARGAITGFMGFKVHHKS